MLEATGIRDVPSGPLLRIGDDRFIAGLRELVERVRLASGGQTRLLIQLIDFLPIRRRPDPGRFLREFLVLTERHRQAFGAAGASDVQIRAWLGALPRAELECVLSPREFEALEVGARERVTDVELEHIAALPQSLPPLFAAAARRARTAGFDGVELHYAHAYTMASFLSPLNTRTDGYGGSVEDRLRLPLEVYRRVRTEVGSDFALGCRFLTEECIAGGAADIVGLARQALANPDWFAKGKAGRGAQVRVCRYTNNCEALDQRHREVTCDFWDRERLDEPGVARSADGKRRLSADERRSEAWSAHESGGSDPYIVRNGLIG